ncbi:MAG: hypothetical protein ACOX3G_08015 [Armatimonadota bacterium]
MRLYLWGDGEQYPVGDFLQELAKSRSKEFKRVTALFDKMASTGKIVNQEQFKDVEGHKPLFEFKAYDVRIFCFFDERGLILVEGDIKKSNKSKDRNRQAIARAQQRFELYQMDKKAGRVEERREY